MLKMPAVFGNIGENDTPIADQLFSQLDIVSLHFWADRFQVNSVQLVKKICLRVKICDVWKLIEVWKLYPVFDGSHIPLIVGVRNWCKPWIWWDGGLGWFPVMNSIPGSLLHDLMVKLPVSKKFLGWKEKWYVHPVLLKYGHVRNLIWDVNNPLVGCQVWVFVFMIQKPHWFYTWTFLMFLACTCVILEENSLEAFCSHRSQQESWPVANIFVLNVATEALQHLCIYSCKILDVLCIIQIVSSYNIPWVLWNLFQVSIPGCPSVGWSATHFVPGWGNNYQTFVKRHEELTQRAGVKADKGIHRLHLGVILVGLVKLRD